MLTGEKIRAVRKLMRLTQEELAKKLKVTRGTVIRWEAAVHSFVPKRAEKKLLAHFPAAFDTNKAEANSECQTCNENENKIHLLQKQVDSDKKVIGHLLSLLERQSE